jgi:hypothetical protein
MFRLPRFHLLSAILGWMTLTIPVAFAHHVQPVQLNLPLEDFSNATIFNFGLESKTARILWDAKIYTLRDLLTFRTSMTAKRFQCFLFRSFGGRGQKKVRALVQRYLPEARTPFVEGSLEQSCLSKQAVLALSFENIRTVDDLYQKRRLMNAQFNRWLRSVPGIGPRSTREIEKFLKRRSEIWMCHQLLLDL